MKFKTQKELVKHVTLKHNLIMCDTCLENLKVFPYEMLCYTQSVCSNILYFVTE